MDQSDALHQPVHSVPDRGPPRPGVQPVRQRRWPLVLVVEYQSADAVIYGRLANPKFGAGGMGTTEFHIENVLKTHADLPKQQMVLLSRALPILDAKNPPRYLCSSPPPRTASSRIPAGRLTRGGAHFLAEMQGIATTRPRRWRSRASISITRTRSSRRRRSWCSPAPTTSTSAITPTARSRQAAQAGSRLRDLRTGTAQHVRVSARRLRQRGRRGLAAFPAQQAGRAELQIV